MINKYDLIDLARQAEIRQPALYRALVAFAGRMDGTVWPNGYDAEMGEDEAFARGFALDVAEARGSVAAYMAGMVS